MRLVAVATAIAFVGALTGGCAHEERVAWPLSAADVQRINGAIDDSGWFRVNYVRSETATALAPIARPTWIRSADADTITFRTVGDGTEQLPANLLTGVTVKDRGRGALVGTGIAVGAVAVELGIWYAFRRYWDREDPVRSRQAMGASSTTSAPAGSR